ncbi:MAG TPA: hypothetical protein PLY70_06750 [Saprospiraceae bacterium]|nr:hypothetical protein [Saprospiraceae bacterium]
MGVALSSIDAQYFGRNKPRYRNFDFQVLETPNFDIHYYTKNRDVLNRFAQMTEMWYDYHKQIVGEEFVNRNPLILYNNHAEFQQTNSISGDIGVGTGGVTEAFKNRVVMPLTFSNEQTYQVLGHELVHAFQFNSILNGDSTSIESLGNLGLWMVEGMAEYMSLGRVDPFTSMWMRDAIINDAVPTIKQMENPKYFPYRYGQAFWSVITGTYGDQYIKPYFKGTAIYGLEFATQAIFEMSTENLSNIWINGLKNHFNPYLRDKVEKPQGKRIFDSKEAGELNVSPSISPNGRYIVFLSERDLFSTDLYLGDIREGKILNKVSSLIKDGDLDHLNFLESSGTWSPNGKDFAFVAFKQGKNVLVVKDADEGKTTATIEIPGIDAIASPAWSPDNKTVVFCGMVEGQPDLFSYNFKTKRVEQLTNDQFSEILPNFNDEGTKLTFCYDKKTMTEGRINGHITYDIAVMDMADKSIEILDVFHGSENLNPSFDFEGNIYFVSERDGFRNLYRYITATGEVFQMTDLLTGISGISRYSPMISVSTKRDKVVYTHYIKNHYELYEASTTNLLNKPVENPKSINQIAGTLPVINQETIDVVNKNLRARDIYNFENPASFTIAPYRPKFKLDYIGGGTGVGVGNNTFGTSTGLQGGIDMLFGDILGNNQMFGQLAVNGEIYDFGGQWSYLNRSNRLAWGVGLSHVPLRTGFQNYFLDTINTNQGLLEVVNNQIDLIRVFDQGFSVFAHYPFSTTLRIEGGIQGSYRSFRYDQYNNYYQPFGNQLQYIGQEREKIPIPDTLQLSQYYSLVKGAGASVNIAVVGDNSFFGLTAPLAGHRYRFGVDKYFGANDFYSVTADYRNYLRMKPFTLATRITSNMRFENRVNSVFPYYVGQAGFVRGYGSAFSYEIIDDLGIDFGQLLGSKIAVGSIELRLPFTGPKRLALIGSRYLLSDLNLFVDAGVAFDEISHLTKGEPLTVFQYDSDGNLIRDIDGRPVSEERLVKPTFAKSIGISARINVLGYLIVEPYFARQLASNGRGTFGLNFIPGW